MSVRAAVQRDTKDEEEPSVNSTAAAKALKSARLSVTVGWARMGAVKRALTHRRNTSPMGGQRHQLRKNALGKKGDSECSKRRSLALSTYL